MPDVVDVLAVAARAASFIFVLQAAGIGLFIAIYRRELRASLNNLCRHGIVFASIAIALVLISQSLSAARMAGDIGGMWDASLESLSWYSSSGAATIVRVVGAMAILIGFLRASNFILVIGVAAIVVSFALTGHTTTHSPRSILTLLLLIHIGVVVFWFGAVHGLLSTDKHSAPQVAALFSKHATLLVPALAIVGLLMAWILLPDLAALTTSYGIALMAKTTGFLSLMPLAALNRQRFVPAMLRGDNPAFASFSRTVKIEYAIIVVVLCVTATMTTLFSPD
jgi:copper resistance protein D